MKRLLAFLLIVQVLFSALSFSAAETEKPVYTSGDWRYWLQEDGKAVLCFYTADHSEVILPDEIDGIAVTGVDSYTFYYCESLISVTIPENILSVGDNPFIFCKNLTEILVSPDHPYLAVVDGVLFSKPDMRLICYPEALADESYEIPQGIEEIGVSAFENCENLKSVIIPDSVTSIGDNAFEQCNALSSVIIPDGVTSI